ncbi:hypothetical protein HQ560_07150 [bacterium]|nr:hypothetical protein [bacterium]
MLMRLAGFLVVTALAFGGDGDGDVVKRRLEPQQDAPNLLRPGQWRPWQKGFEREGTTFVCDNGSDRTVQRGASQTVLLDQKTPRPIVARAWSKADSVGAGGRSDYSLYLDLTYQDGAQLWGQIAPFRSGSHDWQRRDVIIFPEKPVKSVHVHLLLRRHTGKAWFRDPQLHEVQAPAGACLFDGVPVMLSETAAAGFQVRDVAADSDFVRIEKTALGLTLDCTRQGAFTDVTVTDTTGRDRAITLVYALPVEGTGVEWLADARRSEAVTGGGEYCTTSSFRAGANGRLSRLPFAALRVGDRGMAVGIDMARPAFFRVGYNAASRELFIAYDLGLCPEKRSAKLRFCQFAFDPAWGFRSALARYYDLFPEAFKRRVAKQGLWMPFAKVSKVRGWEDFGFAFKEGGNETAWDDAHGLVTFRYTEPMTWWMKMPKGMARTSEAALAHAQALAAKGDPRAKAFMTSGFHDEDGQFSAQLRDTPWCDGAVWSSNPSPGVVGEVTEFKQKWNAALLEKLYGAGRKADLDGEYIDSIEGYVTETLDHRRSHLKASATPLTFSLDTRRVGAFKGLIVFEYARAIASDMHARGKLMMANGSPGRFCWLSPLLDVMGTETNWNPNGTWRPMSDADLLHRRVLCGAKPYCFLMNTRFEQFPHERVERYMKRCLAYGMFPGFFSHNASQGHYFSRPELYDRDRPLFKKYVPLCKRVAEAGWQPITQARSSDAHVYVERFGDRYLTVFNDSQERRAAIIALDSKPTRASRELLSGRPIAWKQGRATFVLDAEDVAVVDLGE